MDISRVFPNEILGIIADHLVSYADFLHLGQTNRLFSQIAIPRLYRLEAKNRPRCGILDWASRKGRVDVLHRAAQSGVSVGDFQLAMNSVYGNHIEVLDFIAESRGEEPFDAGELTMLVQAACPRFKMLSHIFDDFGASLDPRKLSVCLIEAIRKNGKECVQLLLHKGADPSADLGLKSALRIAIEGGNSDIVNMLLENGANLHDEINAYFNPIHMAARSGRIDMLKVLLKHGADPSNTTADGRTALQLAISHDKIAAACLLIQKTTNHGASMQTLFSAMRHGRHGASINLVQLHLEAGVARAGLINTRDFVGRTLLFMAARQGKPKIVQQFLAHGADIHIPNDFGTTPIFAAARNGHVAVVKQLLDADPGLIESVDELYKGYSLLYWAHRSGSYSLVNFLRQIIKLAGLEDPLDARGQSTAYEYALKRKMICACDACARRLPCFGAVECKWYKGDIVLCPECYHHLKRTRRLNEAY